MTVAPGVDTSGIDIEGAEKAYRKLWQLADAAYADPNKDWASALATVAMPSVANEMLDGIKSMREAGIRNIGHSSILISAVSAKPLAIDFEACVNTSGVDTVDGTGSSVRSGDGAGSRWKFVQTATFVMNDNAWLASSAMGHTDQSC
jgi:hypothetical protein